MEMATSADRRVVSTATLASEATLDSAEVMAAFTETLLPAATVDSTAIAVSTVAAGRAVDFMEEVATADAVNNFK